MPARPPRRASRGAPALVIAGTHDPATPYLWGRRYAEQLGNARLLTYRSDGHGALTSLNPCVVQAASEYVTDGTLPARGATCTQLGEPFPSSAATAQRTPGDTPTWRLR